jgi:2-hydroxychromene-2-carboxylate isomerase
MADKVQFYFSFRSPYSWLALYRINLIRDELPVEIQLTPVFPSRDKDDVMLSDQKKVKYVVKDVNRMASAYGLDMKWPKPFDTDWLAVHIAYIY